MVVPFNVPETVYVGRGSLAHLSDEVKKFNAGRILLITDAGLRSAGMEEKVLEILDSKGVRVEVFDDVEPEPRACTVEKVGRLVVENGYQLLIGLGGGSPMDVAKGAAMLAVNGGRISDYVGANLVPRKGLPTIMLPTTAGTGAEASKIAVFIFEDIKAKLGVFSHNLMASTAIVDPELTLTLPVHLTAATGVDALVHAIEAFTSVKATPQTDIFALEAIRLITANIRTAVYDGANLDAREKMSLAAYFAGVAFGNAGVTGVHALSHTLGGLFHVSHGVSNAVLLAPVMEYNIMGNISKFARVAEAMGEPVAGKNPREAAAMTVRAARELTKDLGIPQSIREFGVTEKDIEALTEIAVNQTRILANNPRILTRSDIENIYRRALG